MDLSSFSWLNDVLGTMLFTTAKLNADDKPIILTSTSKQEGQIVKIEIRLVGEVQPTDFHYMQFFNIVL